MDVCPLCCRVMDWQPVQAISCRLFFHILFNLLNWGRQLISISHHGGPASQHRETRLVWLSWCWLSPCSNKADHLSERALRGQKTVKSKPSSSGLTGPWMNVFCCGICASQRGIPYAEPPLTPGHTENSSQLKMQMFLNFKLNLYWLTLLG